MFRIATLLAALLVLPSTSLAEWNSTSPSAGVGAGQTVTSVNKGQCVFETVLYTGQGSLLQAPIWPAMAQVNANISGTDEGDVQVEIRRCPPGTQSYSANVCQVTEYKNAAGAVVSTIDGDTSDGTDAIYGMRSPVYVTNTTTYPEQTSGDVTNADSGTVTNSDSGTATAGSTTSTLEDTTKSGSWTTDLWAGYRVENTTETETQLILSNTTTVLTIDGTWSSGEPDGDSYQIIDGDTTLTATGESWSVDEWAGWRVENTTAAETALIASNTATRLTLSGTWTTEPEAGDSFEVIDGTLTLTDTSEDWSDDEWNGDRIRNTTNGEIRIVDDTDGTLESVTVTVAWDTAPAVGDDYEILDSTRSAEVAICVDAE